MTCASFVLLLLSAAHHSGPAQEATRLTAGTVLERQMNAGETHRYEVLLREGEYFQAVIEQRGVDVATAVADPQGRVFFEINSPDQDNGPEPLAFIAPGTGPHGLVVRQSGAILPPARYTIRVEAVGEPDDDDRLRVETVRAQAEAWRLVRAGERKPQEMLQLLGTALAGWTALGDRRMRMWTENLLGVVYTAYLQEYGVAHDYHRRALASAREIGDELGEALVLVHLAHSHRRRGQFDEARSCLDRALALHRAAGRRTSEANTLQGLGLLLSDAGDLQPALDRLYEALPLYGDLASFAEALTRAGIGDLYLRLGEYELAIEQYRLAVGVWPGLQARSLAQSGVAYFKLGDFAAAQSAYGEALKAFRSLGRPVDEAATALNLGILQREQGKLAEAHETLARAAALLQTRGHRLWEARARCELGETHRRLGDREAARGAFDAALTLVKDAGPSSSLCAAEGLARLARDGGDLASARRHAEQAVEIAESLRASVASQQSRAATLASKQPLYELLIDIRMGQHDADPAAGHDAAALEASERARARSLLELLGQGRIDVREGADPAVLAEERSLRRQLNVRAEAQEQALGAGRKELADTLAREIAGLTAQLVELEERIGRSSPRYAALTQPRPLTLVEIRAQALDADTVLLEYAFGEKSSYLWVVSTDGLTSRRLAARDEIERAARRVYEAVSSVPARAVGAPERAARELAADELSRLILPRDVSLMARKRLLVVAPGALQYVPFAILPVQGESRVPLMARWEIVSAASASVLATLRREARDRSPASKAVAVFADPVFDVSDPRVVAPRGRSVPGARSGGDEVEWRSPDPLERALRSVRGARAGPLTRLPFSRQEADAIADMAAPGTSLRAAGFDANRAAAMSPRLADYGIVHFATHGVVNPRQAELSGVVLSLVDRSGQPQDGFLRLHDIYNLRLGAALVVLSGCQTALGKAVSGEGLVGLTRGFMYAGARTVVASLWQVDDESTAELMKRFYRGMLKENRRPADALRQAQLEMSRDTRWSAPFYWAGFVLQGEWR